MFSLIISNSAFSSEIVVSIKPLHSLVSAVAGDNNSVSLLIEGSMSPHNFALKPSHAKLLNNAKIVFYIDNQLESALKRTKDMYNSPEFAEYSKKVSGVRKVVNSYMMVRLADF